MSNFFKTSSPPMSRPDRQSPGILDDYAVRKDVATLSGTIEKIPVNGNDIVNKSYLELYSASGASLISLSGAVLNLSGALFNLSGSNTSEHSIFSNNISSLSGAFYSLSGANASQHTIFTNNINSLSGAFYTLSGANYIEHQTINSNISSLSGAFYALSGANQSAHAGFTSDISSLSGAFYILSGSNASQHNNFLQLSGGNANQNINIGSYGLKSTGTLSGSKIDLSSDIIINSSGSNVYWDNTVNSANTHIRTKSSIGTVQDFLFNENGIFIAPTSFRVNNNGSDDIGSGPNIYLGNLANNRAWVVSQLTSNNHLDMWYYNGSSWNQLHRFYNNGDLKIIGNISGSGITASDLTSGRVPFATTNGKLTDDAGFLFAGGAAVGLSLVGASANANLNLQSNAASGGNWTVSTGSTSGNSLVYDLVIKDNNIINSPVVFSLNSSGLGLGTTRQTEKLQVSGGNICVSGSGVFKKNGSLGVGGTFTTADSKTVTVSGGIIISIV